MFCAKIVLLFVILNQVLSSAIPIWELLTHQEKIGNLTFVFLQLVHQYCKHSDIPDCEKVLTLYGVSNLVRESEQTLDRLDPFHTDTRGPLWNTAMNGAFDLPPQEMGRRHFQMELERDLNTISNSDMDYKFSRNYDDYNIEKERYPHAVRVAPPPHFKYPQASKEITKRTLNRGKTLSNSNSPSASARSAVRRTQLRSGKTAMTRDSPIFSIIPYIKSSASEAAKNARKSGTRNSLAAKRRVPSSSSVHQPRAEGASPFYVLPSSRKNEPILLKILTN